MGDEGLTAMARVGQWLVSWPPRRPTASHLLSASVTIILACTANIGGHGRCRVGCALARRSKQSQHPHDLTEQGVICEPDRQRREAFAPFRVDSALLISAFGHFLRPETSQRQDALRVELCDHPRRSRLGAAGGLGLPRDSRRSVCRRQESPLGLSRRVGCTSIPSGQNTASREVRING